jgi:hypothetical protein
MDPHDLQQWIDDFGAAESADRESSAASRARPDWSIALALSMIESAPLSLGDPRIEALRRPDDEAARSVWECLRGRR